MVVVALEGGDGVTVEDVVERDRIEVGVVLGRWWAAAEVRVRRRRSIHEIFQCGAVLVLLRWDVGLMI